MDTLPIELVTIIACDTFETFIALLRVGTIGNRLCAEYPQLIARSKFISTIVHDNYSICTYLNNKLHSFNDKPACVHLDGDLSWYKYGNCHRSGDLPAYTKVSGYKSWYWNGLRHREDDLPAIECISGDKFWYKNGIKYRQYIANMVVNLCLNNQN